MSKTVARDIEKHIGKWVAIKNHTVVASSDSIEEVSQVVEQKHIHKPTFFKVPRLTKGHSFF